MPGSDAPSRKTSRGRRPQAWVRKNMVMDQAKLSLAKRVLGARTETEAVDAALDLVAFRAEVFAGLDALAATGPIRPLYRRA
jgi:hypothetical protein